MVNIPMIFFNTPKKYHISLHQSQTTMINTRRQHIQYHTLNNRLDTDEIRSETPHVITQKTAFSAAYYQSNKKLLQVTK